MYKGLDVCTSVFVCENLLDGNSAENNFIVAFEQINNVLWEFALVTGILAGWMSNSLNSYFISLWDY